MTGWRTQVSGEYEPPKGTIGIVVAQKFPDPEIMRVKIEEGIERTGPDTVWVMRDAERKGHAANYAWQTFKSNGIIPFLAPLVPAWKRAIPVFGPTLSGRVMPKETVYDFRAGWRDAELRATCERIIVFHDKSSNITADWIDYVISRHDYPSDAPQCNAKVYVIERGKTRARTRRGRVPVGT